MSDEQTHKMEAARAEVQRVRDTITSCYHSYSCPACPPDNGVCTCGLTSWMDEYEKAYEPVEELIRHRVWLDADRFLELIVNSVLITFLVPDHRYEAVREAVKEYRVRLAGRYNPSKEV